MSTAQPSQKDPYRGFDRDAKAILALAEEYGWTFRVTKNGHAVGTAPDGPGHRLTVPSRMAYGHARDNVRQAFKRWLAQTKVQPPEVERTIEAIAASTGEKADDITNAVLTRAAVRHQVNAVERALTVAEVPHEVEVGEDGSVRVGVVEEPTIVSQAPWLAHKAAATKSHPGFRYESQAVVERKWSDGHVDWVCVKGDYQHLENPVSVARHYGAAHREEKVGGSSASPRPLVSDPTYTETTYTRDYSPSARVVDALEEYLRLAGQPFDNLHDLARAMLTWAHTRPDLPVAPEYMGAQPLSPEDQIARIQAIVGQPFASRVAALEVELAEVKAERDRMNSELDALAEVIDGLRTRNARVVDVQP